MIQALCVFGWCSTHGMACAWQACWLRDVGE
jgi:hypothetical protein